MRAERRLLQGLMDFANGKALNACIEIGTVHAYPSCIPILRVRSLDGWSWAYPYRDDARSALDLAIRDPESLQAEINKELRAEILSPLRVSRRRAKPALGHAALALAVFDNASWIAAVLALAFLTKVTADDSIANRIARCEACDSYFLLPTSRPSRACSAECRKKLRKAA